MTNEKNGEWKGKEYYEMSGSFVAAKKDTYLVKVRMKKTQSKKMKIV